MDAVSAAQFSNAPADEAAECLDADRLRDIVLVRIATAGKPLARADLSHDVWPIVSHLVTSSQCQTLIDRDLGALADAGLCDVKPIAVTITAAGTKRAALIMGVNALPRSWTEAKAARIVAKALGIESLPPRRLKALAKADGLRAAIVQQAFKLKLRGVPTPSKLREHLAALALSHAFGHSLPSVAQGRTGMSAKAGRGLAGRLANPPRDFPSDARLIAALATEHVGASRADLTSLQSAVLRRYVTRRQSAVAAPAIKSAARGRKSPSPEISRGPAGASPQLRLVESVPAPVTATVVGLSPRPDFATFVASVRVAAQGVAEGWPGNRKAFVSKVWSNISAAHPHWAVSPIEFKAMLVEAHRLGTITLANADLKDQRAIADIQASAIAYKNAIFHYVRVDD